MGDLGIAWLVSADEAHAVAAQVRSDAVEKEEDGEKEKDGHFASAGPTEGAFARTLRQVRSGGFQIGFHFQHFSSYDGSFESNKDLICVIELIRIGSVCPGNLLAEPGPCFMKPLKSESRIVRDKANRFVWNLKGTRPPVQVQFLIER
jgi:hypothetical protein